MGIVKSKATNLYYIVRASRLKETGDNQLQQGQEDQALQTYRNCLEYAVPALEDTHPFLLSTYQNLGMLCWKQGNYEECLSNLKKVETALCKTPEQEVNISKFNDLMGTVYGEFGKYEEAFECYKKALEFAEKKPEETANDIPSLSYKAGMALMPIGKHEEALPYLEKAQDIWLERGVDQSDAEICRNLARISEVQGDDEEALMYYNKALELRRLKGEGEGEDGESAAILYAIAECYQRGNKIEEAMKNYEACLEMRKKLGEDREIVASTYHTLGMLNIAQRKLEEAQKLLEKALEIRKKVTGEESEEATKSYDALGQVYREQGKVKESMEWYNKALEVKEKLHGKESGEVADTYFGIAQAYHKEEKEDEALVFYQKAEKISEKVFGEKNVHLASIYFGMGLVLLKKQRGQEGLERIQLCYEIRKKWLGEKHVLTVEAGNFLQTFTTNMQNAMGEQAQE